MPETTSHRTHRQSWQAALLLGFTIFTLLWMVYQPYRKLYVPNGHDIVALADGSLLAADASWQNWFTRGYSDLWTLYPDWDRSTSRTAFTRPAFQFLIYLAHFPLGADWASYAVISCFAAAGMAALAFLIAQRSLDLPTGLSSLAAALVVLSPPVLNSWLRGLAFAIEPLATIFVAAAFLASVARRDFLCLALLFLALLTKENTAWAPVAAATTIMLRPKLDETLRRRALAAVAMLLPLTMWLALQFVFFGGIGGTYATAGYAPIADFLRLTSEKLAHMPSLLVTNYLTTGRWTLLNQAVEIATTLLVFVLLGLWAFHVLTETAKGLRYVLREERWPTADAPSLVALWAATAVAFHLAVPLPLAAERYATSVVVFAWPALVAEIARRRKIVLWLLLAIPLVVSLVGNANLASENATWSVVQYGKYRSMGAVLHQAPKGTRHVYVLSAADDSALQRANPKYLGPVLGLTAEIVRVGEIEWNCDKSNHLVAFDHSKVEGVVNVAITLPTCASFCFDGIQLDKTAFASGRLYRGDTMSYELPKETPLIEYSRWWGPRFCLGQRVTVRVRTNGPARFIIEHGAPNEIAWFDVP